MVLWGITTYLATNLAFVFLTPVRDYEDLLGAAAASFIISYFCFYLIKIEKKMLRHFVAFIIYCLIFVLLIIGY